MSRAFGWLVLGLGCLAVVALVSGRGPWFWNSYSAEDVVEETFVVGPAAQVVVETINGPIEVHTGLAGKVTATVTKRGSGSSQEDADADLENIDVQLMKEGETIRIAVRRLYGHSNGGASVKLYIPPAAILDLHTSNGTIDVNGPTGGVTARSSNGQIHVAGARGEVHAQTSNGRIKIDADPKLVEARTSNGRIEFAGRLGDGGHIFETSNGGIVLNLPADSGFQFEARTSSGRITNKFAANKSDVKRKRQMSGTVGNATGCRLSLRTSNGSIQIQPHDGANAEDDDDDD
jgi:hypothetical protein